MSAHTDDQPYPASLLVLDFRRFGSRANARRQPARKYLQSALAGAFDRGGVSWPECVREERAEGLLIVVPALVPKPVLLDRVLCELVAALRVPPLAPDGTRVRVRIALHAGDIRRDRHGFGGDEVDRVFRLAHSTTLRRALEHTTSACAILLSDPLYQAMVRRPDGVFDARRYHSVVVGQQEPRITAWLRVPGDDYRAMVVAAASYPDDAADPERRW
ncbi:MAG TPA: hypothetical protein VHW44_30545 [Pseudonocardiaceae bacterium]|jgi:hypothetical protein|nr:hypothetical protein [Pseudonocardiaceae bacterium]